MTKLKTLCASGALLLIGSTLALAQTITPPTDGSHPDLATAERPDNRYVAAVPPNLGSPAPQVVLGLTTTPPTDGSHPDMATAER